MHHVQQPCPPSAAPRSADAVSAPPPGGGGGRGGGGEEGERGGAPTAVTTPARYPPRHPARAPPRAAAAPRRAPGAIAGARPPRASGQGYPTRGGCTGGQSRTAGGRGGAPGRDGGRPAARGGAQRGAGGGAEAAAAPAGAAAAARAAPGGSRLTGPRLGEPGGECADGYNPFWDFSGSQIRFLEVVKVALLWPLALLALIMLLLELCAYVLCLRVLELFGNRLSEEEMYARVFRLSRFFSRLCLQTAGWSLEFVGEHNWHAATASGGPFVCMGNHNTLFDMFAMSATVGPYVTVARKDLETWPLVGTIGRAWHGIWVDRKGGDGNSERLKKAILSPGTGRTHGPVGMFPEGCITNGKCICEFRRGGFVAGAPVLPIKFEWDSGDVSPEWVLPHNTLMQVFRLILKPGKRFRATFLPLYRPNAEEIADAAVYARGVQLVMARSLGIPASTKWTNRDSISMQKTCIHVPDG